MLFGKKNCSQCGSSHDVVDATCPACRCKDENFDTLGIPENILWLPIWKQIVIFVIGLIGLNIFSLIGELIFYNYYEEHYVTFITLVNVFRYSLAAISIAAVLFGDFYRFKPHLKKWQPWLLGVAFGIGIIIATILYNAIVNSFYTTTDNDNQEAVNSVVSAYPYASIILLGIVGPVVEEFTYHVGLYSFLRRVNKYLAYAVTVVIFGLIHFNITATGDSMINELLNLPSYMIAGFILTLAYEKFGLSCCVVAHVTNNLFSILIIILFNVIS